MRCGAVRCCPLAEWREVASDRLLDEDGQTADRTGSGPEAFSDGARRSEPALFLQSGTKEQAGHAHNLPATPTGSGLKGFCSLCLFFLSFAGLEVCCIKKNEVGSEQLT